MRLRERSRIVLMAAGGMTNVAIARELKTHTDKVGRWRRRYADEGIGGIEKERPRGGNHGGRCPKAQAALRTEIIRRTTREVPPTLPPVSPGARPVRSSGVAVLAAGGRVRALDHLTVETGQVRRSPLREVGPDVLARLRRSLALALASADPVPIGGGWSMVAREEVDPALLRRLDAAGWPDDPELRRRLHGDPAADG